MAGNDLIPTGAPRNTAISLPTRLRVRCDDAAAEQHGALIVAPRELSDAAREALPGWRALVEPAAPTDRIAVLVTLANMTGKPDVLRNGNGGEQRAFWAKYHELLAHVPVNVLSRACDSFLLSPAPAGGKWFPDPGTLLQHARNDDEWRENLRTVKGLERVAAARPPKGEQESSPEAWAEVSEKIANMKNRFRGLDAADRAQREAENVAALDWFRPGAERPWKKVPREGSIS